MAILTQLTLDADGTIDTVNIDHDGGTGSPYFSHCNDIPDGNSSDFVQNDDGETSGKARFRLTNVNADFGSMDTLTVDVDVLALGFSNDTCTLTARIFDADDEVTPLTDETATLGDDLDTPRVQRNVSFAGLTGSKSQWDSAFIQFTWTYNKVGGPDNANLQLFGCDIDGTYTAGVADIEVDLALGTYTFTGQTIEILVDQEFNMDTGVYTVNGPTLSILIDREINLDTGSYSLTGNTIDITFFKEVNLDLGVYTLTGQDIIILVDKKINLNLGTYILTGQDIEILVDKEVNLDLGTYSLIGNNITFLINKEVNLDTITYILDGKAISILWEGESNMAERPFTIVKDGNWLKISWDTVTDSDTCQPIYVNHNISDILMQVTGTFNSASISMTGGVTKSLGITAMVDPGGTAVAITSAGGSPIRDLWPFIAPATTSGSGSDVDIEVRMKIVK